MINSVNTINVKVKRELCSNFNFLKINNWIVIGISKEINQYLYDFNANNANTERLIPKVGIISSQPVISQKPKTQRVIVFDFVMCDLTH